MDELTPAERIKLLMRRRGLKTQRELASTSGVSQPAISRILKHNPRRVAWQTRWKIATALKVHPSDIWPDHDTMDAAPGRNRLSNKLIMPGHVGRRR